MSEIKKWISAFPVHPDSVISEDAGMLLRDFFAATALAGLTARIGCRDLITQQTMEALTACAYALADEMLKKREAK